MPNEFLAQSLRSNQLLALLFICESKRKNRPPSDDAWNELLETFSARLGNLSEDLRFEVLEAHLMSVEDIDVYDNSSLETLLNENRETLDSLASKVDHDPRFQLPN